MVISYFGAEFFKVQFGDLTLAFNPISKDSKLKGAKFGSDIVLVSKNDVDLNGIEQVAFGEKKPFVVEGPGEYEVRDVRIRGFQSGLDSKGRHNTIYSVALEGMNLLFLGALPKKDLPADTKEALPDVDVLFVPIGGDEVLTGAEAEKLSVALEAKIVIPMHYGDDKAGQALLTDFLKEGGNEKAERVDKLTLKKKDLEGKEGDVIVITPNAA